MQILKSDRGLPIIFKPIPGKLVSLQYFVRCGSLDETNSNEKGLSHALEHMLFAGTDSLSWKEIISGYRECGADSNAETSFGYTSYYAVSPTSGFEQSLSLTSDIIYNASLPKERWEEVEKRAIINEMLMFWDDPDWVMWEKIYQHAFGKNYHSPIGKLKSVKKAKIESLQQHKERYYVGSNIFLTVAGDLSPEQLLKVVNKYDRWSAGKPVRKERVSLSWKPEKFVSRSSNLHQSVVLLMKPLSKPKTTRDVFQRKLLLGILQDYLHQALREELGLCYSVDVSLFDALPDHDYLEIITSAKPTDTRELFLKLDLNFRRFATEGISQQSVDESKMAHLRSLLQVETCVSSVTTVLGTHWLNGRKTDPFEDMYSEVERMSVRGLQKLAKRELSGKHKIGIFKS